MEKCECGKEFKNKRGLVVHGIHCKKYIRIPKKISKYKLNDNLYRCECGKEFDNYQSLNAHLSHCIIHRNGKPPRPNRKQMGLMWHNLSPERIKEIRKSIGKSLSDNIKSGKTKAGWKGKHHSIETKKKLSEKRSDYLDKHPGFSVNFYDVSNGKRVIRVQGKWELKVAEWLNEQNIEWERKRLKFLHRSYTPDFYIDDNTLIEVKGFMRERDLYKMKLFKESNPHYKLLIIERKEIENINDLKFEDLKTLESKYDLDKINESVFKSYK